MRRRSLLLAFGGLLLATAGAVGARTLPRIGVLRPYLPADRLYAAFIAGLRALGDVDGETVQIEYRQATDQRLAEQAQELVRLPVDVIFAPNPAQAQAARKATLSIPIVVAAVGDPVRTGLAASLARPGGNVTGLTALGSNLSGKRLELLKEMVRGLGRVAVLWNPAVPDKLIEWQEMQAPGRAMGLELVSVEVRTGADFGPAFEMIGRLRPQALIALGEPLLSMHRGQVIAFAARNRLAAMFNWREAAEEGALIAYGPDIADLYRRAAGYVDKLLKGAKPGDLPIEEPTRFDFVVNLRTAEALGLAIPPAILAGADRVIE